MFHFHKVILGEVDMFFSYIGKNFLPPYSSAKISKLNDVFHSYDYKCAATFLMKHGVLCLYIVILSRFQVLCEAKSDECG